MLKTIAVAVAVVIVGILVYAATKPDSFRVQRAASIDAPPEKIFAVLNDFRRWDAWSPWEKKDPAMKRSFSGAPSGKGARYAWEGDKNVGQGSLEIAESVAPSRLAMRLDFVKPFEAHNIVEFALEPRGNGTNVVWSMQGGMPYVSKLMSVFIDMDQMIGKDFEAGLANLKAVAEKS
jgi:carbon monoxide dehydrogenase subunit G